MSVTESNTENDFSGLPAGRQVYELSYLLLPSIPEETLSDVVTKIEKIIEDKGGKKIDGESPFLRELAYEMTKVVGASRYVVKNAYIGWIKFELPVVEDADKHPVEEINTLITEMTEVLRFLLVKAEKETRFTFASTMQSEEPVEESEEATETSEVDEDDKEENEDDNDSVDESDTE